jgi:plasmid segregation protein ParM
MNISAVDIGFKNVKGIINGKKVLMKSVVGDAKTLRFEDLNMGTKSADHLKSKVGSKEYFVSDLAIEQSDTVYYSLNDDRFNSESTDVLVKTAFGLGFGNESTQTAVVSGLPASHYVVYKKDIETLFLGSHRYAVMDNRKLLKGSVKVTEGKFIPQPFGALLDRLLDESGRVSDKQLIGKTVAVIDIGFGTTDVFVASMLNTIERLTFSTKTAINHSHNYISNKIEENFGILLPLYSIEKIVETQEFRNKGKSYDMTQLIQKAYYNTSSQLIAEITNKWKTIHEIDHILLAGGGGIALAKQILPHFENIELLEDAQWAIVNGYYKWGVRHFAEAVHV